MTIFVFGVQCINSVKNCIDLLVLSLAISLVTGATGTVGTTGTVGATGGVETYGCHHTVEVGGTIDTVVSSLPVLLSSGNSVPVVSWIPTRLV